MSVIWNKVWFDLWHNKVRTGLAVLSIAVGVFAIGVTFGLSDQLLSTMDQSHQAIYPSHVNMILTTSIDRDAATSLKTVPGVEAVEPYNQVTVRYKLRPQDERKQGTLVMRDDYERQQYDVVELKAGRWPGKDDIGIERLSGQSLGVDVGDQVIFKVGNSERALPISGQIRHPFVLPPDFGGPAFFFANGQGLEHFDISDGRFSSLLIRVKPYSADHAREVASSIKDRLAKQGVSVAATVYQDPYKHWARDRVSAITLVLQVLAVVSLLTSTILVFNTLMALITQQTDQIGIIKAIGGGTDTILKVYLAGAFVYGLLALVISLPVGALAAFGASQWILSLLNIDYEVLKVSEQALVFQALAATLVPLLAASLPVLNGATMTVQAAIASYGLGGDFGSSWLDRVVERMGQRLLPSHYAIALGNMFRRKGRLILTQLVLTTAGAMFLTVMGLYSSLTLTISHDIARRAYDVILQFRDNQRTDQALQIAQSVDGVEKSELWFLQPATILKEGKRAKEAGFGAELTGLPAGSEIYTPFIVAGRWLQPGDGRAIVMNRKTANDNHIQVGDTVTLDLGALGKNDWQVVGLYQVVFGGDMETEAIYTFRDAAFEATKKYNQGAQLFVRTRLRNGGYTNTVANQLKTLYEKRKMDVSRSQTIYESRDEAESQFSMITMMLLSLAIVAAVVGGIGLMGSLSIGVVERTKEIGVMRAIGARSGAILGMFVMEGILQGLFSWAMAIPLSFVLGPIMANATGQALFEANLDYQYGWPAVGIWLVIVVIISTLASILPARSATLISVRDSLAYA